MKKKTNLKDYGLILPKKSVVKKEGHYVLGETSFVPKVIKRPDGQWDNYLPAFEAQQQGIETYNCTAFGTTNVTETILLTLGILDNYSDRYLGVIAGTRPPGNDPHVVAEAARKKGFIPESKLPYLNTSVEEYFSYTGSDETSCTNLGRKWLDKYTFLHEWVFVGGKKKEERTKLLKEALQYSPLGISVTAWIERDGVYVDAGNQNNHWTVCYGYNDKGWKVFDSYENSHKIVSYDHNIYMAKRYYITPKELARPTLLESLQSLYQAIIRRITMKKTLIEALIQVESGGDDYAIGDKALANKAYGCLQIRQPAVNDCNKVLGTAYRAEETLGNRNLSLKLFETYINLYEPNGTDEDKARLWNGGPKWRSKRWATDGYWEKVKKIMN